MANFAAGYGLTMWGGRPSPDSVHPYGIRFRGGHWSYFQPAPGAYVDRWSLPLHFVLLAAGFVVAWRHRDRFQRVEPVPPPSGPVRPWEWLWLVTVIPAALSLVGGAVIEILLREAGWTAALVAALVFVLLSLAAVLYASRPLARRSPPPLEWPLGLSLAAAVTLIALALAALLFGHFG
jgi:heme/copper-type cytochrome/quinol oxidase subunit 2